MIPAAEMTFHPSPEFNLHSTILDTASHRLSQDAVAMWNKMEHGEINVLDPLIDADSLVFF